VAAEMSSSMQQVFGLAQEAMRPVREAIQPLASVAGSPWVPAVDTAARTLGAAADAVADAGRTAFQDWLRGGTTPTPGPPAAVASERLDPGSAEMVNQTRPPFEIEKTWAGLLRRRWWAAPLAAFAAYGVLRWAGRPRPRGSGGPANGRHELEA
jgi:hypothetical protein